MTGGRDMKQKADLKRTRRKKEMPEWASGLRQLYDSVVEEPLPNSFDDLLKKLDSDD